MEIDPNDLTITYVRSGIDRTGGWSLERQSGVVVLHKPSGARVSSGKSADRQTNMQIAMALLKKSLRAHSNGTVPPTTFLGATVSVDALASGNRQIAFVGAGGFCDPALLPYLQDDGRFSIPWEAAARLRISFVGGGGGAVNNNDTSVFHVGNGGGMPGGSSNVAAVMAENARKFADAALTDRSIYNKAIEDAAKVADGAFCHDPMGAQALEDLAVEIRKLKLPDSTAATEVQHQPV